MSRHAVPNFAVQSQSSSMLVAGVNDNDDKYNKPSSEQKTNWAGCVVVIAFVAIGVSIAGIVFAVVASRTANNALGQKVYDTGNEIGSRPVTHLLTGAALPMTLPNDLSDYVGITYHVNSDVLQAHTITIQSGALTTTWDGSNTVATFAGVAKGEGFTFSVVAADVIRLGSVTGVTFS